MSARVSATAPKKAESIITLALRPTELMFAFVALVSVDREYKGTDPSIIAALKDWDKVVPIIKRLLGCHIGNGSVWNTDGAIDKMTESAWDAVAHHILKLIATDPFGSLKVIFRRLDDLVDDESYVYKGKNEDTYLNGCDIAKDQHVVWTEVRDLLQKAKEMAEAGILDQNRIKFVCVVKYE
jgi:hypothetical protein